jgi:hypothetical protein
MTTASFPWHQQCALDNAAGGQEMASKTHLCPHVMVLLYLSFIKTDALTDW